MKLRTMLLLFVAIQPALVFLHIYRNNLSIRHNYTYQKRVALRDSLLRKKEQCNQKLCSLQNQQKIKKYAQNFLGMEKVKLRQIKKLDHA